VELSMLTNTTDMIEINLKVLDTCFANCECFYNFNTIFSSSSIPQWHQKVQHVNLLETLDVKGVP
jgi:hypothetical protein